VTVAVVLILAAAAVDFVTPPTLRFYFFYWPSIAMATWYVGPRWGYVAAALSAAALSLANGAGWAASGTFVLCWNVTVNAVSFVLLAFLIVQMRSVVDWERSVARTDFLTGLPNSRAFSEALALELARSSRSRAPLSVAYVDIDDFKLVNDRLGHGAGDNTIMQLAERLRSGVRAFDTVSRLGGDEFAILLAETGAAEARVVIGRLLHRLGAPLAGVSWRVSASIGLVTCTDGARSADELIRRADDLMYEAKQAGKNVARFAELAAHFDAAP
jgi:diguanylate cyclase (GGDEF)-like protein